MYFIYYAHAYLLTLVLFVYLLLKRAPRKIGYQPIGLPSQNKEFTYLLNKAMTSGDACPQRAFINFSQHMYRWLVLSISLYVERRQYFIDLMFAIQELIISVSLWLINSA